MPETLTESPLTLKKVKLYPKLSEETNAFSADIYWHGRKIGEATNDGHGGSHRYYWSDGNAGEELIAWASQQPTEFNFDKLDQAVDARLSDFEARRFLTKLLKNHVVFRLAGDKRGEWRTIKTALSPALAAKLRRDYPNQGLVIANEDFEAAIAAEVASVPESRV